MSQINIGVNNISRKVKDGWIGVDDKSRKIKKGWIGVDNKARLFYEYKSPEQLIPFTSSPVPTSWTAITAGTNYKATNTYGEWQIKADNTSTNNFPISYAFDSSVTTYYGTANISSGSKVSYVYLNCPENVSINPSKITVKYQYCGSTGYSCIVQASTDNSSWDNLGTLLINSNTQTSTFDIATDNYYKYFRIKLYRFNSTYRAQYIYDFKITNGTLKIG